MLKRQAYKYQLRPTGDQQRQMLRFAGSCRFVWNRMLDLQKQRLDSGEPVLRYNQAALLLPDWKKERPWLKDDAHSQALQHTLKALDRALMDTFDRTSPKRFPRFKKKGVRDAFCFPQGCTLDQANGRICLPKIGWVRYRNSRAVLGTVKNVTVSRSGDHWYVSIQTEREVADPKHPAVSAVGIDLGITRFATLSDGSFVEPLNSFKHHEKRLACEQRRLARKVTFSNNWHRQKKKITRLHQRIGHVRTDFLHQTSSAISKNHAIVVLEDLRIRNMSASSRGTVERPGKNVKQKRGLNRSILDQGWAEFRRQLDYKQHWRGGLVIAVPPHNTSRTCPICSHVSANNRKTQATFLCVSCGHAEHADLVAAKNILAAGHAVSACGEPVQPGRSVKQEPTEELRHVA
jgi:putative transposase